MNDTPNIPLRAGTVVVAVDGSPHADRALAWAAHQAALEGRPLSVLLSCSETAMRNIGWLDGQGIDHAVLHAELAEADAAILLLASDKARRLEPSIHVTTHLSGLDARSALVAASAEAHLLVMGSRGRGPVASMVLGSVGCWVSVHALCPVVVVRPGADPGQFGGIVVGADETPFSVQVLEFAFRHASVRAADLTVIHVLPHVPRDLVDHPVADPWELGEVGLMLAESLAGMREKFPDVRATFQLGRGQVDEVLTRVASTRDLLVVGRPQRNLAERLLHGTTALAVLECAPGAVAVVPEARA